MLRFQIDSARGSNPCVLFLGAHCDDIEIACGGTILQLLEVSPDADVHWVVFSSSGTRREELLSSARQFLGSKADRRVRAYDFQDGFLPWEGRKVKEVFEELKRQIEPDMIFTHRPSDRHQDHRILGELTWNTWRDHIVLEYEVPKYEGDLGQPNTYIPISRAHTDRKIAILHDAYTTQGQKNWFDDETFRGYMRLRGIESRTHYAEAFHARKFTLKFAGKRPEDALFAAQRQIEEI